MNAPDAGTIKEFLVNEEDTVTVGLEIVKLELGGAHGGEAQASQQPKSSASAEQPAPSDDKAGQKPAEPAAPDRQASDKASQSAPDPPAREPKEPSSPPSQTEAQKPGAAGAKPSRPEPAAAQDSKAADTKSGSTNRDERRVSSYCYAVEVRP